MKIWNKIEDFFIHWFWWKWRSEWLNRQTNKDRKFVFEKLLEYQRKNKSYLYVGFGSVLRHHRDGTLKDQDLDIVISREDYNDKFIKFVKKGMGAEEWRDIFVGDELICGKFLLNKRTPLEFIIADIKKDRQITKFVIDSKLSFERNVTKVTIEKCETEDGPVPFPKNRELYIEETYGEDWRTPIKTSSYDPYKNDYGEKFKALKDQKPWEKVY